MPKAAVIHEKGAPDVFRWEEVEVGEPGEGEVRICNNAVGVNYVDIITDLGAPGSLFVTRPAIMHYMAKRADLEASAAELFEAVSSGKVRIAVNHVLPLREVAEAHRAIEAGRTTGSTVLLPFE